MTSFTWRLPPAGPLPVGHYPHHRTTEDVLLLRPETEASRDPLFHWRHPARVLQVAFHRSHCRDLWVLEPLWVRLLPCITSSPIHSLVAVLYR